MSAVTSDLAQASIGYRWSSYLDAPLAIEGARSSLLLAVLAGVGFDVGLRSGVAGVGGALAVLVVSVGLLSSGRIRSAQSRVLIAAAPLFGTWLAIRSTPWLLPFDVVASAALLLLGVSLSSGGSVLDLSIPQAVARAAQSAVQALLVPAFLIQGVQTKARGRRLVRAIAIAVPLMVVLTALFASADAVFARAIHTDVTGAVGNAFLIALGTIGAGWLLRIASLRHTSLPEVSAPTLAPVEWTIVLAGLDLVLAGFAAAQLVALSSGGKHLLETSGFTYAQYARSGFFQLLAAIMITGLSLIALHASAGEGRTRRRFRALAFAAITLTFVVVVSAFHRLAVYEHAYGMTMLRLYVHIAIVGAGLLLAILAIRIGGLAPRRAWFAPVAGIVVLATLLGINVANPEAFVARYNLSHPSAHFDPSYLNNLSADAAPALVRTKAICKLAGDRGRGWAAFNVSRDRAQSLRKQYCP